MINRISILAISAMLSGMFTAPSYAQTINWAVNSGHSDAKLSIDGMTDETNRTIVPGAARDAGLLNQDKNVPALSTFAFNLYPATLCSAATSFLVYQSSGSSPAYMSHLFAGDYDLDHNMEGLLPMQEVMTLFFTRTSVHLVDLWGGKLRVDGFMGTLNMQNVQLGPSAAGGLRDFRPPRENYLRGPRSVDLYGVSVSFHIGRDAGTERRSEVRRSLSRIIGDILG
jgi:hypothetical protein